MQVLVCLRAWVSATRGALVKYSCVCVRAARAMLPMWQVCSIYSLYWYISTNTDAEGAALQRVVRESRARKARAAQACEVMCVVKLNLACGRWLRWHVQARAWKTMIQDKRHRHWLRYARGGGLSY